jgi:uncharacterized damage-inducible protein DinB
MTPAGAVLMARYNRWMNRRMYAAALGLPAEDAARDRGAFFGSLLETLNHVAVADCIWLHRFAQHPEAAQLRTDLADIPAPTALRQALAPSLPALWTIRAGLDAIIADWAGTLSAAQLDGALHYRNLAGVAQSKGLAVLVLHVFNHQTHRRGQASTLLHQAGIGVGITDLAAYTGED